VVSAQDFTVNGVNYSVIPGTKTVKVASNVNFTGNLILPSTVNFSGTNF